MVYCHRDINDHKGSDDRSMIQELSEGKILISKDNYKEFKLMPAYKKLIETRSFQEFSFFIPEDRLKGNNDQIYLSEVRIDLDRDELFKRWYKIIDHSVDFSDVARVSESEEADYLKKMSPSRSFDRPDHAIMNNSFDFSHLAKTIENFNRSPEVRSRSMSQMTNAFNSRSSSGNRFSSLEVEETN